MKFRMYLEEVSKDNPESDRFITHSIFDGTLQEAAEHMQDLIAEVTPTVIKIEWKRANESSLDRTEFEKVMETLT